MSNESRKSSKSRSNKSDGSGKSVNEKNVKESKQSREAESPTGLKFKPNQEIDNGWFATKKINEGGFGAIYGVEHKEVSTVTV